MANVDTGNRLGSMADSQAGSECVRESGKMEFGIAGLPGSKSRL